MKLILSVAVLLMTASAFGAVETFGETDTGLEALELESINGPITVEQAAGSRLTVSWRISADDQVSLERMEVLSEENSGTLSVWTEFADGDHTVHGGRVEYTVGVPEGWDGELHLTQVNGPVSCLAGGDYSIYVQCVNGEVELRDVTGQAELEIVNGELEFQGLPRLSDVSVVSASVRGRISELSENLSVESVSGNLHLYIDEELPGTVEVTTMSGDISIADGLSGFSFESSMVGESASRGQGEPIISVSTVSGRVEIETN